MKKLLLIAVLLLSVGCTSVATSTLAFVVAKQSQRQEVKDRQYKGINKCFVKGKPEAFFLADSVLYGSPLVQNPEVMLNPEHLRKDSISSHDVAYAYYVIAERIGDKRAAGGKARMMKYLKEQDAANVEAYIDKKYLQSYLRKCFAVQPRYKVYVKPRDRV